MFSLTEHKSWNGFLGQGRPEDTVALASILGSVYVADSIAKSGRNIAAEIRHGNAELMQQIASSTSDVTAELRNMDGTLREIGARLDWGFSDLLKANQQMNQTLEELLKTAKSPSQTWAFEQFDMAREAHSRGLDKEALEYINNAINGFQGQTGNKLDPRFHFLKGSILLGSVQHHDPEIVDVQAAKQCFEDAARYAAGSKDEETRLFAAEAYCHAAFAAYCLDDMVAGDNLCTQALTADPKLAEAYYLAAKISSRQGKESVAFRCVRKALDIDPDYIVKFSTDKDFSKSDVIDQAEDDYVEAYRKTSDEAVRVYKDLKAFTNVDFKEPVTFDIQDGEGILECGVRTQNLCLAGDVVLEKFREALLTDHNKVRSHASSKATAAKTTIGPASEAIIRFFATAVAIILGFIVGLSASGFLTGLLFAAIAFFGTPVVVGVMVDSNKGNKEKEAAIAENAVHTTTREHEQLFEKAIALRERMDEILGVRKVIDGEAA